MGKFEKGNKIAKGRPKGAKSKLNKLLAFNGFTAEDQRTIFNEAMKLVKKGNVTIINKFLDKMLPNIQPMVLDPEGNLIPEIIIHVRDNKVTT